MPTILKSTILAHDGKGRGYRILELVKMIDAGLLDGSSPREGMKQLQTDRGKIVNSLGNGKYRIVATNEILTEDEPSQN